MRVYYALKSNSHPVVVQTLVKAGLGLDVSSGCELELALRCETTGIVFSGPGKTQNELSLAVRNADRITVLVDSFGELERLECVAAGVGASVRAGVRLTTDEQVLWRKFGIPLSALSRFFAEAEKCSHVFLRGVQFHTSWNLDAGNQVSFIRRLGDAFRGMGASRLSKIEFIDIGGGFWPPQGEWLQAAPAPEGTARRAAPSPFQRPLRHYKRSSVSIDEFATEISKALLTHLFPFVRCSIYAEPGRWLCNDALHIILTVIDRKAKDLVITDAGTNAIGWERFETDYFPVINLSRPGATEHACYVLGSLCTPHDVWGYGYFGQDIREGDVLLIPTQGAYTYSLRQEFIKPLPEVVMLRADGVVEKVPPCA